MIKQIRLEEHVYNGLEEMRGKRETFSQAVERLLDLYQKIRRLEPVLRGSVAYQEFWAAREREEAAAKGG